MQWRSKEILCTSATLVAAAVWLVSAWITASLRKFPTPHAFFPLTIRAREVWHSAPSAGPGAFSVSLTTDGAALISETGPSGVANGSAISSYEIAANGVLTPISTSVPTLGAANCWNVVTPDGSIVYTSNAGSSTI